jgi:hypothetical protein
MTDKTEPRFPDTVQVSVKYLRALRSAAGLAIDPKTADVMWWHAQTLDPYGDLPRIPDGFDSVGREYFARAPGSDVWINFGHLPQATRDALWATYRCKLSFPAGLFDVDTIVSRH